MSAPECTCPQMGRFRAWFQFGNRAGPDKILCPLHAAAVEMYEALEAFKHFTRGVPFKPAEIALRHGRGEP